MVVNVFFLEINVNALDWYELAEEQGAKEMNINKRFANWLRSYMDTIHYMSEMEEELMTKKKEKVFKNLQEYVEELDRQIIEELDKFNIKKKPNWDLVFSLIPTPVLHEIYIRLEEGSKAIEENKRIKASLDTVNEAIKKMFKLV